MIGGKNKELYYASSIDKQLNIEVIGTKHVIDNSTREQDTFTLTETLNDGTELKFGSCLPNQISFTGREVPIATKGMKLRVTETLEGNENDPFVYGTYTVQSDTPTADRTKRQIVAYDAMYDIINADVKSWYDGLSFPMTLKAFRDSFFAYLGIEQKETSLVNDSMTVNKTLVTTQSEDSSVTAESTISGKTIIEAICEINGAFGNIGRGGRFEYVILKAIISALYPAEDLYPREDLFPSDANTESMTGHYITFDYEAFQSQAITQLEIRADDSTAGAIVGTSGNNYVISGNFLISDKTGAEMKQIADNLLPVIAQAEYTPIKSCTCVGNPCLELGDPIRFNTSREIVESYILQRTLTGVQSKRDAIASAGTEKHAVQNQTTREMVESIKRRTHALEETADHMQSTYEDLEQQTSSKFEQAADAIEAEVLDRKNADLEMRTKIAATAHSVAITASGGEQSVGITIQLYDENGNLIDTKSDGANITITGFVRFNDLENAGSTTINGANITTGYINCDRLSGGTITGVGFYQKGSSGEVWIEDGYIKITGQIECEGGYVATQNWVAYEAFVQRAISADSAESAKKAETANYAETASYVANTASDKHTANMYSNSSNKMYYCPQGSSRRFKNNIVQVIDDRLDPHRLYDIDVVQFQYKPSFYNLPEGTPMETVIGFIAEDIYDKYPVACEFDEDTGVINNWLERYMIPPMLALIQEQHKEIEQLKIDNILLKGEVDILKQRLGKMEEMLDVINSKIS